MIGKAKQFRGGGFTLSRLLQSLFDETACHFIKPLLQLKAVTQYLDMIWHSSSRHGKHRRLNVLLSDIWTCRPNDSAQQRVIELADIAGPCVGLQKFQCGRSNGLILCFGPACRICVNACQKMER